MKKSIFLTSLVFEYIEDITMMDNYTLQKTQKFQDAFVVNENWIWYNLNNNLNCIGRFYIWTTMLFIGI